MQKTTQQLSIIDFISNRSANLLIDAGPGCGKTSTVKMAVEEILRVKPNAQILYTSFYRSAINEATAKLPSQVFVAGFHQIGYALLNQKRVGWVNTSADKMRFIGMKILKDKGFLTSQKVFWEILRDSCRLFDLAQTNLSDFSAASLQQIAALNNIPWDEYYRELLPEMLVQNESNVFRGWRGKKGMQSSWSFSDMLYWSVMKNLRPYSSMKIGGKPFPKNGFDYIFVDEAQDLGEVHRPLLRQIASPKTQFVFVGDRRQAINLFAGAASDSIGKIESEFNTERLPLSICFRLSANVVDFINQKFAPIFGEEYTHLVAAKTTDGIIDHISVDNLPDIFEQFGNEVALITRFQRGKKARAYPILFSLLRQGILVNIAGMDVENLCKEVFQMVRLENETLPFGKFDEGLMEVLMKTSYKGERLEELQENIAIVRGFLAWASAKTEDEFFTKLSALEHAKNVPIMTTAHKAKGLEWEITIIIDEANFPYYDKRNSPEQNAQEQNCAWVAFTRSLQHIFLLN